MDARAVRLDRGKKELEEVLKSKQGKLNDTQEKGKDAEAILISYETPLPRHNKDNEEPA